MIPRYTLNAVVPCQRFIHYCKIRVDKIENTAIGLQQLPKESHWFKRHGFFQGGGELGPRFAINFQILQCMQPQPLLHKLCGEAFSPRIFQHSCYLLGQDLVVSKFPT